MADPDEVPAIVLAGGLGTRLRSVSRGLPKPLVPVAGRPFLAYVLDMLREQGVKSVIMAVSQRTDAVQAHFGARYKEIAITYSVEEIPLGTGGAILKCIRDHDLRRTLALNGDTLFRVNIPDLLRAHRERGSLVTVALRKVADASRYGIVSCDQTGHIETFHEKTDDAKPGLVNGGIYVIEREAFAGYDSQKAFSFEQDLLQVDVTRLHAVGVEYGGYFIDIGIPADHRRACLELGRDD